MFQQTRPGILRDVSTKTPKNAVPVQTASPGSQNHRMELGLGELIDRRETLRHRYRAGIATDWENAERALLDEALNSIRIPINASCVPGEDMNRDGIPDTIQFFELAAKSDCCVLQHKEDTPRIAPPGKKKWGRL